MMPMRQAVPRAVIVLLAFAPAGWAQSPDGFDANLVALTYHKVTGEPLDLRAVAEASEAARRASNFDRADAVTAEAARLQTLLEAAVPAREFVISINDAVSEYDHDHGEFSIELFRPGYFVPIQALGQQYQIAFANAERARPIAMPRERARELDARLNAIGRRLTNEIRFRVVGKGDPAGAVTGARVIRAEIISARLLDRDGRVVFTPSVTPAPAAAGAAASSFDAAAADVAGFHVGVKAKDLEATLERLFGPVTREPAGKNGYPGLVGSLNVNPMGCFTMPGRRQNPRPGAVCVTALFDRDAIVRSIRVERLFPSFDAELFRKALVQKYGAVASAQNVANLSLGRGPEVDPALLYDRSGPRNALTAHYASDDDFMGRGLNSLPRIRVVLQLVDAPWASKHAAP